MANIKNISIALWIVLLITLSPVVALAATGPVAPSQPKTTPGTITDGNGNTTVVCGVGQDGCVPVGGTEGQDNGTTCPTSTFPAFPKPCTGEYICQGDSNECLKNNPIMQWTVYFINLLTSLVGVAAVIMIIIAGLQYAAARDNPQAIQAAKQRIINVLIGLVAFIFIYTFLQWLIPGGIFS